VIETVPENLELKRDIFSAVLQRAPAGVPVVSNASGLPITSIAGDMPTAERTAGLHFFLPAHLVPVVEVVRGERTSDETMDRVHGFMQAVGRVPVRVRRDTPGFLANRIQHALMREAFAVIDEELASPEDVDAAVRFGFGFRYVAAGPLMQKEFAGLDTQLAAARSIYPGLSKSSEPSEVLTRLVAQGRTGAKTLRGFWEWTPERLQAARDEYEATLLRALELLKTPTSRREQG
jgi:3-hydroxybutyryl-CoA dehydrogenase